MKKQILTSILCFLILFGLTGCTVRTYSLTKDRVDQELTGNRGYLLGTPPEQASQERKTTRTTQVVEIELSPPVKFEKRPAQKPQEPLYKTKDRELWGNVGYVSGGPLEQRYTEQEAVPAGVSFEKYTVQKNDTLQKISKKFYGTIKKWTMIYQANKDILKSPDRIYPGQVIDIPVEPLKETEENLK